MVFMGMGEYHIVQTRHLPVLQIGHYPLSPHIPAPLLPIGGISPSVDQKVKPTGCFDVIAVTLPHVYRRNFQGTANHRRQRSNDKYQSGQNGQPKPSPLGLNDRRLTEPPSRIQKEQPPKEDLKPSYPYRGPLTGKGQEKFFQCTHYVDCQVSEGSGSKGSQTK